MLPGHTPGSTLESRVGQFGPGGLSSKQSCYDDVPLGSNKVRLVRYGLAATRRRALVGY